MVLFQILIIQIIISEKNILPYSGKQALFIGKSKLRSVPQDVVLDLHNKSKGTWKLAWKMFLPNRKRIGIL